MKKMICALLVMLCVVSLCACSGDKTCKEHTFEGPTCTSPKTCTVCGYTEGAELRHNWIPANCVDPRTCSRCGEIDETAPLHNFADATCTEPKTCLRCYLTEGEPAGHTWENGVCSVCEAFQETATSDEG